MNFRDDVISVWSDIDSDSSASFRAVNVKKYTNLHKLFLFY